LKLPRDLSGRDLTKLLRRFGYDVVRQEGSHLRLLSNYRGFPHLITIPNHPELKIGTLRAIVRLVADYLQIQPADLIQDLLKR
jgi:predicted RNA binding protein YcfA (HicA-like mRNA interferase family)